MEDVKKLKRNKLSNFFAILPVIVLIVIFIISLLTGRLFNLGESNREITIEGGTSNQNEKPLKNIAIVVHDMKHMFMFNVATMIKEQAKENENLNIILYDSQGNNDLQNTQLQELVVSKVDGVILNPNDKSLINNAIKHLKAAGIPIVGVNMNISEPLFDSYIGSQSVEAGEIQCKYIAEKLNGKGKILILKGIEGQEVTAGRLKGVMNVLKLYPGIKIAEAASANWEKQKAAEVIKSMLDKNKDIAAVISQNDEMILGALPILEQNGVKAVTIGIDGLPEALVALKNGSLNATVYQNAKAQANSAFTSIMKLIKKERADKEILIPYELVTNENVDKYMDQSLGIYN